MTRYNGKGNYYMHANVYDRLNCVCSFVGKGYKEIQSVCSFKHVGHYY